MQIELIDLKTLPYKLQEETRNWRNLEIVSKFFQIKYIDEEIHTEWLKKINSSLPTNIAYVIKCDNSYIGLTYFRNISTSADLGIYIYKQDFLGKGIGSIVLEKMIDYAKNTLKLEKIFLEVLKDNTRAIKLYENFSFKRNFQNELIYRYELNLI